MLSISEIKDILKDLESDWIERTISTTNTDKFGQAICAFANDLPGHKHSGYLFIGVNDDGSIGNIKVTDELLKNLSAIRTDGNIQPQPSMTVEKVSFPEGDIIVIEVQPAIFPPVRYKGRVWVRVGSRKAIANEADEHILLERRASSVRTFDSTPCFDTSLDDLNLRLFKYEYLPKAIPEEILDNDRRNIKEQLQALGFYDLKYDCPTYAGMLFFGNNVERFLGGAYVQYVKFNGSKRTGEIVTEHKFSGNLCTILTEIDTFIGTTIVNRRPIPVSAAREEMVMDYPYWAIRELIMNAICHRDYTGNGPVQFYQYDDCIEVLNPGGLYGKANAENFPRVNDYRNIVVAEGMKVLGYVNRFSRGVLQVQEQLNGNGNGEAEFDLGLITAFFVKVNISQKGQILEQQALEKGLWGAKKGSKPLQKGSKPSQKGSKPLQKGSESSQKGSKPLQKGSDFLQNGAFSTQLEKAVYDALVSNPKQKYSTLAVNVGSSESSVKRAIQLLKEHGHIDKNKPKNKGVWNVI